MVDDRRQARQSASDDECATVLAQAEPRFEYFDRFLAHWRELEVLDVGCGRGCVSELLARRGCRVSAVDPSRDAVRDAAERSVGAGLSIDFSVGAPHDLPYEDRAFDVVVCLDVLGHVEDVSGVVGEMSRVLQPGGYFLFDAINRTWTARIVVVWLLEHLLRRKPRGAHDWSRFVQPAELRRILSRHGFLDVSLAGLPVRGAIQEGGSGVEVVDDMSVAYLGVGRTPPGPPAV